MHVPQWLYCAWHLEQAWRKKLNCISDVTKRCATYKLVRILADEPDAEAFSVLMKMVLKKLSQDPDLTAFANYFSQEYAPHPERWALCYRIYCGINTNMLLESMHKVLKYYYLDGKKVRRLDRGLCALLKYTRDKLINRLIAAKRGKLTPHLKAIRERHERSLGLKSTIMPNGDGSWMISSESKPDFYTVTKEQNVLCLCTLKCEVCNVCEHEYRCTCMDSMKSFICKHIHRVVVTYGKDEHCESPIDHEDVSADELQIQEENEDRVEASILEDLSAKNRVVKGTAMKLEQMKRDLESEVVHLIRSTSNCDQVEVIKNAILPVPHVLKALENGLVFRNPNRLHDKVNPSAHIVPQRPLYSTRKERKKTTSAHSMCKPSDVEREQLLAALLLPEQQQVNEGENNSIF